jgi:hypothetical protein
MPSRMSSASTKRRQMRNKPEVYEIVTDFGPVRLKPSTIVAPVGAYSLQIRPVGGFSGVLDDVSVREVLP